MARPRSPYPPKTAAQRQAKCRAVKRGTWHYCQEVPCDLPPECRNPNLALPPAPQKQTPALAGPTPALMAAPMAAPRAALMGPPPGAPTSSSQAGLPAPRRPEVAAGTAIHKAHFAGASSDASRLALLDANANANADANADADGAGAALALSLPPAVAARLRSLLERQDAGKSLTANERAEAEGLLDIAEYFVVHRLRRRLAA